MDINHLEQKFNTLEEKIFLSNLMKAEEENSKNYVVKGIALKRKSTKKKAEIKSLEESL